MQRSQKDLQKKPKKGLGSNREIMMTTYMFVLLFLGMMGFLGYYVVNNQHDLLNNNYNTRQELLTEQNYRGTIYSKDGEVLAQTVVDSQGTETRVYPYENMFSHIIGYSTKGRSGVESIANYYLINSNTSLANKAANLDADLKNPGDRVITTLDVDLQKIASNEMGIYKGAILVTEVATGKILALVSKPDFDPNKIDDIWNDLISDSNSSVLVNRATQGLYPPGSTFKIITTLEYMRENPVTCQNYNYNCIGYYKIDDIRINCYHNINHGQVNLTTAFAKSCNSSFADIGMTLDRVQFADTLNDLLFNQNLPLNLSYSKSSIQMSEETTDSQMIQASIGQGRTQMTPVHLHMITQAIAYNGVLMRPYVVDRVENDVGNIVKSFHPESYKSLMTEEESAFLMGLMEEVVKTGTGTKLSGRSYTAAGKTGSAEYSDAKGESHAWFTGYAPADHPEIAVTIIMEGAGSGGDYAVPIARRIFDAYFNQ